MTPMVTQLTWVSFIAPTIIMIGFVLNTKSKVLILTAGFYLVTLYLYAPRLPTSA